ncbi:membrane protein [Adhaeribacter aerolatus]|uniref:Membrane protein n=1 Tax=Adhaeribacter aerolatus TaxID=670289 RepID=A0A512B3B5_9BACT|nr:RagB/SusD family nutrient uptake outer membrane protein [Adhaeribacter aerolatus]GEO06460.1 membrane protein [Adhaeribacter aerolatus]
MKTNKLLNAIGLAALLFLNISCEDILKEEPKSLATADRYYTTPKGIEDGLSAAYSHLRSFYGQEQGFFLTVTGTDIFTNGFGGIANSPDINNYSPNLLGTNAMITTVWDSFYKGINQSNTIIGRAPSVTGLNEQQKARIIGEARFLRALYYFHLVQQFGDVHFTLEETIGVQTTANRTPLAEIYAKGIVPDLAYAVANLPLTPGKYGQATKPAAEALLARVQLTIGNWAQAETLAKSVIDNPAFKLVTPYAALWNINNDVNSEIIWAVQFTGDPLTNGPGNSGHLYFIFDYTFNPAMVRNIDDGRPYQRFLPTNHLIKLFDPAIDSRWNGSFKTVWRANRTATINGFTVNPGDTSIKIVRYPVPDNVKRSKPYWLIDFKDNWIGSVTAFQEVGTNNRRNHPALLKFLDPLRPSVNETAGRRDFPVIRLAEMYLVAAEAAMKQGKNEVAANYINVIRNRAAIPGKEQQMRVSAADITLDFILEERARELAGEMHRWYDLKRTGKLLELVKKYNRDAAPNIKEMHLVRPIPQTQIDRVTNPGEFYQNQGY